MATNRKSQAKALADPRPTSPPDLLTFRSLSLIGGKIGPLLNGSPTGSPDRASSVTGRLPSDADQARLQAHAAASLPRFSRDTVALADGGAELKASPSSKKVCVNLSALLAQHGEQLLGNVSAAMTFLPPDPDRPVAGWAPSGSPLGAESPPLKGLKLWRHLLAEEQFHTNVLQQQQQPSEPKCVPVMASAAELRCSTASTDLCVHACRGATEVHMNNRPPRGPDDRNGRLHLTPHPGLKRPVQQSRGQYEDTVSVCGATCTSTGATDT
ncbi:hypothetical protein AGIG_G22758 [Arapaima gigas]